MSRQATFVRVINQVLKITVCSEQLRKPHMAKGPASKARIAWKSFGRDLRKARRSFGSLRFVAESLGIDKATMSRAENGKPIEPAKFLWLGDWAGLDVRCYLAPIYTRDR